MQLIQWTLFIDMLGYRDINGTINNDERANDFMAFMEKNEKEFIEINSKEKKDLHKDSEINVYEFYEISSCFVSDSLIITFKPKADKAHLDQTKANIISINAFYILISNLFNFSLNCFKEKKIFLRGGISNKYCLIKKNFAIGEGLIQAYIAESKIAKMPQIAVHPDITNNQDIMLGFVNYSTTLYNGHSILKRDTNGHYFVDIIGYALAILSVCKSNAKKNEKDENHYNKMLNAIDDYLKHHSDAISHNLIELNARHQSINSKEESKKNETIKALEKINWLKNYHNEKIKDHSVFKKYMIK